VTPITPPTNPTGLTADEAALRALTEAHNALAHENEELRETVLMLAEGMERVAETVPQAVRYMPGLAWMPQQARALLERKRS
jgi:histidinol-phosphate/aromatic aminotransferase/cobyric acid decarboxylase-like protein